MSCQEFKEMFDSYLSGELLVETNHEVLRHLENCAECRSELAARRKLRGQIRAAVKNSSELRISAVFAARLRQNLRERALPPGYREQIKRGRLFNFKVLTSVAALFIIISLFTALWLNRVSPSSSENTRAANVQSSRSIEVSRPSSLPAAQAVQAAWRESAQTAIGDHENCALEFRLKELPITLEQAAEKFGRFNKNLDKAVISAVRKAPAKKVSDKIEFLEAHSCVFQNRRFAHVVLRYHQHLVSIIVADADFPAENGEETLISQSNDNRMKVASFRAARQAVFVVSDLDAADNLTVAQIISPAVRSHIERAAG